MNNIKLNHRLNILLLLFSLMLFSSGCSRGVSTDNIATVDNFDAERYMGVWYEIARFPHYFESGLHDVSATYTLTESGEITVFNRGLKSDGKEKSIKGSAYLCGDGTHGELKVTFFWPFYGDYRIIYLSDDYSTAIVTSDTMDYLWVLGRKNNITEAQKSEYIKFLTEKQFNVSKLIWFNKQ